MCVCVVISYSDTWDETADVLTQPSPDDNRAHKNINLGCDRTAGWLMTMLSSNMGNFENGLLHIYFMFCDKTKIMKKYISQNVWINLRDTKWPQEAANLYSTLSVFPFVLVCG